MPSTLDYVVTNARVTFLLPVASPAPFLRETLESIRAQSVTDWHVVAVLDGPARERALLRSLISPAKLTLVEKPEREGLPAALNAGLQVTTSEFVARIDADDICLPDRVERQLRAAREWPHAALIGGGAELIDELGHVTGVRKVPYGPDIRRHLIARNVIVHSSAMLRRDCVVRAGSYNALCSIREDYELWLRLAAFGPLAAVEEPVVQYRISEGQLSRTRPPKVSLDYVRVSQRNAAKTLGLSRYETEVRAFSWRFAQSTAGQRLMQVARR